MIRRIFSFLMCLCLCASLLSAAALADDTSYDIHVIVNGYDGGGVFLVDENGNQLSSTLYKNGDVIENVTGAVYCACLGEYPYTREITGYQGDVEVTFIADPTAIVRGPGANGYAELTVTYTEISDDASGGTSDEPDGGTSEPFTVSLTVNYEDSYTGEHIGGLGVYDENGNLLKVYNESAVIDVAAGEILITKALEIADANMSSSWAYCGAHFIDGVEYVAFQENGSVEITYGDSGSGGEGPVGPQPAAADFNVILDINLPDDYTGDGAVVTRKTRENGDGAVIDFGDNMTYGDGDTIAVKAGEWALFGYEELTGYTGNWHSNGTMYEGLIAVVDAPEDGSDYTLVLEYVTIDGITVSFAGSAGIQPGSRFGAGTLEEHAFAVMVDGNAVTNFTITSADESVCTVKNENGTVVVTNVGYGESVLTITVDGVSEEFTWVCLNDGDASGEPSGPVVSEDDYTVEVKVEYDSDYTGPQDGGIIAFDENGNRLGRYDDGEIITVPGGTKFYFVPADVAVDGVLAVDTNVIGSSGMEVVNDMDLIACYDDSVITLVYSVVDLGGITLNFAGFTGIRPGESFGAGNMGEHPVTVLKDGVAVTNFTVTSSDESVCTVRNENGTLIVTNLAYGEPTLTITVDGVSAEFTWVCINDGASDESPVTVGSVGDTLSDTNAALNTEDVVVNDLTEDGSGNALLITSSTESGVEISVFVHTENGAAIQAAVDDENVILSVSFNSTHMGEGELSETDMAALAQVENDMEPGKTCGVMTCMDLTANLEAVDADGKTNHLGSVKELSEDASFCMQVSKAALDAMGRDIHHLTIVRIHDGVAETIWKFGDEYEEIAEGYNLFFTTDRFSTYALMYERVVGDIDGDDKANQATDLVRMMKYLAGEDVIVVKNSTDINGDGSSDILDVIRMARLIA